MPHKKAKTIEKYNSIKDDLEYSSDEDIKLQPNKKKKLSDAVSDNFVFDQNFDSNQYWESLLKTIKNKKPKTLANQVEATKQITVESKKTTVETNSDDDLSDEYLVEDNLSEWSVKKKKKSCKDNELIKDFIDISKEIREKDIRNFHELNLSRPLLKAICEMNYSDPTPIQIATIPYALAGKDICGCAATGTGKTAAYMLPVLERLIYRPKRNMAVTRVLVLVPTRELGVQVYDNTCKLSRYTDIETGLSIGGLDAKVQEACLRKHPDIVIATPGRLVHHLHNSPTFSLDAIDVLIIDEADRILDENFEDQLNEITQQCSYTRQTMLFSATMTTKVQDLAKVCLKNPVKLFVNSGDEVQRNVRQEFIRIRDEKKRDAYLASLICRTFRDHCIVFVHMKKDARRLAATFKCLGLRAGELHGNLSQAKRLEILEQFKNRKIDVLFATDVAARGIDIPGIKTVINYKMPFETKQYIHRVGRTARAGRVGVSVSLFASKSEIKCMKEIFSSSVDKPKKRTISLAIIDKYQAKLEAVAEKVHEVLQNDLVEQLIVQEEKKIKEAEEAIKNNGEISKAEQKRSWIETKKERRKKEKQQNMKRKTELNKTKNRPGFRFKKPVLKKKKSQKDEKLSTSNVNMQHVRNQIRTIKCKSRKRKLKAYDE